MLTSYAAFDPYHKVLFNLPIFCNVGWGGQRPSFSEDMGGRMYTPILLTRNLRSHLWKFTNP